MGAAAVRDGAYTQTAGVALQLAAAVAVSWVLPGNPCEHWCAGCCCCCPCCCPCCVCVLEPDRDSGLCARGEEEEEEEKEEEEAALRRRAAHAALRVGELDAAAAAGATEPGLEVGVGEAVKAAAEGAPSVGGELVAELAGRPGLPHSSCRTVCSRAGGSSAWWWLSGPAHCALSPLGENNGLLVCDRPSRLRYPGERWEVRASVVSWGRSERQAAAASWWGRARGVAG